MKTIAEGQANLMRLWGTPKPKDTFYRLMKYVLSVDCEGRTLLQNVVTGELVLLDSEESSLLKRLPTTFTAEMIGLIASHFLVPVDYDEYDAVAGMRKVLRALTPKPKYITHYTILPTTACNARCYYCFEKGSKIETMSEQTAEDVIRFITEHCGEEKKVSFTWFGGEPTVAAHRIDQICKGLQVEGIQYSSMMYTNGYLCDKPFIEKAKKLWHLNSVQMSVDGTDNLYNRIKAYVNAQDNPYQTVMRNIGYMLDEGITVAVRMNVDYINYENFSDLVRDCVERYQGTQHFSLCAYPLIGEYEDNDGNLNHASEDWISEKVQELNELAKDSGLLRPSTELPTLTFQACVADNDAAITIGADGRLVRCAEQYKPEDAIGTVISGIENPILAKEWKYLHESKGCMDCAFHPCCLQLSKCSGSGHCFRKGRNQRYVWNALYCLERFSKGGE